MLLEMLGCYLDSDWAQALGCVQTVQEPEPETMAARVTSCSSLSLAPVPGLVSASQSMVRPREVQSAGPGYMAASTAAIA